MEHDSDGFDPETCERIARMIEANPAYWTICCELIEHCRDERTEEEACAFCEGQRTSQSQIQSAAGIVGALVRSGALSKRVFVDGEPYAGTLEELQADEDVAEDAAVAVTLASTLEGVAAAADVRKERSFDRLVAPCPQRRDAFLAVLAACAATPRTTRELQDALKGAGMLETEAARGIDGLHASYFTGSLESVGALAWNGKAWAATDAGRAILAE
ncbi:hypothetical protein [Xiamenia xianingshaonis]|uniref:Uncharacterized protein n=1 Tax=Xiamenia xianingshaonis TaxID=2682776 RepID=A0ABX0IG80_9ACTN|nr:hypothetical protein [Xiamenia xianingshaonis]NHM13613.1 hypothetical protein [Xiamenia xianingshaonis]